MPVCIKCKTKNNRLDYFGFPTDKEVKKKWLNFVKPDGLRLRKESKLCSRHFTPDDIIIDADKRILKDGSVPCVEVQRIRGANPNKRVSSSKKCILCGNNSTDLSYFSIPKEPEMKEKWEKFCEFEFGEGNYSLCHLHFKPKYIRMENNKRRLAPHAIPSIYFDDYQFEFIPVDRNKPNNEDSLSDVECVTIDHSYNSRNHDENSIISIDYEGCNTSPRTSTGKNSTFSKKTTQNSVTNDIVNIFIPSYEDPSADQDSTNNRSSSCTNKTASKNSVAVYSSTGRRKRMYYPGDMKDEDIKSLEVAKIGIQNFRKVIDKKSKTIKVLSLKVRRLATKNAALKETIRQLRAEKAAKEAKETDDLFEVKGWWDS